MKTRLYKFTITRILEKYIIELTQSRLGCSCMGYQMTGNKEVFSFQQQST